MDWKLFNLQQMQLSQGKLQVTSTTVAYKNNTALILY